MKINPITSNQIFNHSPMLPALAREGSVEEAQFTAEFFEALAEQKRLEEGYFEGSIMNLSNKIITYLEEMSNQPKETLTSEDLNQRIQLKFHKLNRLWEALNEKILFEKTFSVLRPHELKPVGLSSLSPYLQNLIQNAIALAVEGNFSKSLETLDDIKDPKALIIGYEQTAEKIRMRFFKNNQSLKNNS